MKSLSQTTLVLGGAFIALCLSFVSFISYAHAQDYENGDGYYPPSSSPTPTAGGGGEDTESDIPPGGGHEMILGDMKLEIIKFISLDGEHYFPAATTENAIIIPENKISKLYVKTRVTNKGPVTAANIHLSHGFDTGLSDMELDSFEMISGVNDNVKYSEKHKEITIENLLVEEAIVFVYAISVNEKGESDERATDSLTLDEYKSRLPITQDGLTYNDIGDQYDNYLVAGNGSTTGQPISFPNSGLGAGSGSGSGGTGSSYGAGAAMPNLLPSTGNNVWISFLVTSLMLSGFFLVRKKA